MKNIPIILMLQAVILIIIFPERSELFTYLIVGVVMFAYLIHILSYSQRNKK